jgi:hypothetical protein
MWHSSWQSILVIMVVRHLLNSVATEYSVVQCSSYFLAQCNALLVGGEATAWYACSQHPAWSEVDWDLALMANELCDGMPCGHAELELWLVSWRACIAHTSNVHHLPVRSDLLRTTCYTWSACTTGQFSLFRFLLLLFRRRSG